MELQPGTIVDRYAVVGLLGQGGMASVYHVRHTRLSSDHVLKVLSLPGQDIRERLLMEGQVQAQLKHKNVVEVTDVIDIQGSPGLVMELVRGPSLDDVLASAPLPLEVVEQLVPGLLAGMAAAHQHGVVHRDLKPANILLAIKGLRVTPKVADFGLVKLVHDSAGKARTQTGATMGTPQYMAPEQIKSAKDVDARADIYALGVILYELVTGRRAFDGDSHYDIFQKVIAGDYLAVSAVRPEVPGSYVAAIDAALSSRDQRPATVEALWEIWSGGETALDDAAARATKWPEGEIGRLKELSPTVALEGISTGASGDASMRRQSNSTFVAPATVSGPTMPVPSHPSESRGPRWGMIAALFVLALGGSVALVGVPVAAWYAGIGAAVPPVVSSPAPPVVVPPPAAVPVLSPSQPVADPAPVTDPKPGPATPAATPAAAPTPTSAPAPAPTDPPEPVPLDMGTVEVTGGVTVTLSSAAGTFSPGPVPAGRYQVTGYFEGQPETFGFAQVTEAETLTIRCVEKMRDCRF